MPRKRAGTRALSDASSTTSESDRAIERGVDALNALRVDMRRVGLIDCADTLDEAFALCLRDYAALKAEGLTKSGPNLDSADKKLN